MSEYPYPVWSELTAISDSAVLRPGDTLIIRVKPERPPQLCIEIAEAAKQVFPDIDVVCIAADGFAIYRPDPPNPNGGTP